MTEFSKEEFYKRLYSYALKIIMFVEKLPNDATCRVLGNQLLRSGTSITSNIIEAKSASSRKDYINFYTYSLKSANESKLWISLLKDAGKCDLAEVELLLNKTQEISRILGSSIVTMKKSKI